MSRGLGRVQRAVLDHLRRHPGSTRAQVVEATGYSQGSVERALTGLAGRKLIRGAPLPLHRGVRPYAWSALDQVTPVVSVGEGA